jgi:hypothetical protein
MSDDEERLQPLYELDTGLPIEHTLVEGVPDYLEKPLRDWGSDFVSNFPAAGKSTALRLRRPPITYLSFLNKEIARDELLHIINFMLQLITERVVVESDFGDPTEHPLFWPPDSATKRIGELEKLLHEGGSIYTVDWTNPAITIRRRLDPGVTAGIERALATADKTAGDFLRIALRQAYGIEPDPVASYGAAVKAVEHIAGPLILPKTTAPSLGQATSHLEQAAGKWRFALAGNGGDDSPVPVTTLMRRLVGGQVSRHAGGAHNRDQTPEEAEAAVQIAVLLVQLLSTGALVRRVTT